MRKITFLLLVFFCTVNSFPQKNVKRSDKEITDKNKLTVATWNIGYGIKFKEILDGMEKINADIFILQEVDKNTKRTGTKDIAFELAHSLGYGFVWSEEFEELSQRDSSLPIKLKTYTGQAILSRYPIKLLQELSFKHQAANWNPHVFPPFNRSWFQPRNGERIAQIVSVNINGVEVIIVNTHLESSVSDLKKVPQMEEIFNALGELNFQNKPTIIAGDMNTGKGSQSPIVKLVHENGYHGALWLAYHNKFSNKLFKAQGTTEKEEVLDWIFVNYNFFVRDAKVLGNIKGSDHYPIFALLEVFSKTR